MTIWEKVTINLEKASKKINTFAALVADRAKAEIAIVRLRLRRDELQGIINEQHRIIGKTVADLSKNKELPRTTEELMAEEEVVAALSEIEARRRDLEDLAREMAGEEAPFKAGTGKDENAL